MASGFSLNQFVVDALAHLTEHLSPLRDLEFPLLIYQSRNVTVIKLNRSQTFICPLQT